jgi:hypothetical protein
MTKIVEVALTGPDDDRHPNALYLFTNNSVYDGERFRRVGSSSGVAGRADLVARGAQFHKLDVPAWVDPKEQAIKKLAALGAELRRDYYTGYANKVEAALALLDPKIANVGIDTLIKF